MGKHAWKGKNIWFRSQSVPPIKIIILVKLFCKTITRTIFFRRFDWFYCWLHINHNYLVILTGIKRNRRKFILDMAFWDFTLTDISDGIRMHLNHVKLNHLSSLCSVMTSQRNGFLIFLVFSSDSISVIHLAPI